PSRLLRSRERDCGHLSLQRSRADVKYVTQTIELIVVATTRWRRSPKAGGGSKDLPGGSGRSKAGPAKERPRRLARVWDRSDQSPPRGLTKHWIVSANRKRYGWPSSA